MPRLIVFVWISVDACFKGQLRRIFLNAVITYKFQYQSINRVEK